MLISSLEITGQLLRFYIVLNTKHKYVLHFKMIRQPINVSIYLDSFYRLTNRIPNCLFSWCGRNLQTRGEILY